MQGANSRLMQNLFYNKGNEWISLTDEDAVISGERGAQEFTDGAVVGGVIGGVQTGVDAAADVLTGAAQIGIPPQKPVQKIPVQTEPDHDILGVAEDAPRKPKQEFSPKEMAEIGEALIASGIMPQQAYLDAMGLDEASARGMMAVLEMGRQDATAEMPPVTSNVNLKPQALMDELINSGEKCNIDEVIVVTKNTDDMLLWLEQGNQKSGLAHIMERHSEDFASQGIEDIPQFITEVLKTVPVKKGSSSKGLYADYVLNGNTYRVAYGTNGYIVSFYPID